MCLCVCLCECVRCPKTEVVGSYELPCGCCELNQVSLQEQSVLFTKLPLQHSHHHTH